MGISENILQCERATSATFSLSSGEYLQATPEGEHTMADNNTQKKKPRWTSLEIGLITIVCLLFVIIVALIILFITQNDKGNFIR